MERNVDVGGMIPQKFFEFGRFERYEKCNPLAFLALETRCGWGCCWMVGWADALLGRRELLEIRREDIDNRSIINRIDNGSKLAFMSLHEIRQEQSEYRALNMARKRQKQPTTSGTSQSLEMESEKSTQISSLGISYCVCPC